MWIKIIALCAVICISFVMCDDDKLIKEETIDDEVPSLMDSSNSKDWEEFDVKENAKEELLNSTNFSKYNEDRLLKIKVKVDGQYVYESDFMEPEMILKGDFFDENGINIGGDNVIGEIYSYTRDKEFIGQTNVVIKSKDK